MLIKSFLSEIEDFFNENSSDRPKMRVGAILIDPGHGGKDPGANMVHKINGKNEKVQELIPVKIFEFN